MDKNTCDIDSISLKIIKLSVEVIGNQFLNVINISLSSGNFPRIWKQSVIVPIEKVYKTILCNEHITSI